LPSETVFQELCPIRLCPPDEIEFKLRNYSESTGVLAVLEAAYELWSM